MSKKELKTGLLAVIISLAAGMAAEVSAQCPEITITEKYDHTPSRVCQLNGWDTIVNCKTTTLQLHAEPFITTQHFNGTYLVESIPYNPPDPTFHAGAHLNISTDDAWENSAIEFPFTFMFFGKPYNSAVVGSNGLVTFNLSQVGQYCAYSYTSPIPQPLGSFVGSSYNSHNAIYGVYEDIHPTSSLTASQGMFRSIGGTYPCRYLCASVNEVPLYPASSHNNDRNSYQIICYEGTNIIEVHVKQRKCCSSTNAGKGIIGIMNETGVAQISHYHDADWLGDYTFYIQPNSPAAFTAPNRNGTTDTFSYEAWRFTPQGETVKTISWWRLFADARGNIIDSVELTSSQTDTNGYYINQDHTTISVSPTVPSIYMVRSIYQGANGYWYGVDGRSMRDTVYIGVDTAKDVQLRMQNNMSTTICEGRTATIQMSYPNTLTLDSCVWSAKKEYNGQLSLMPANAITDRFTSCILNSQAHHLTANHIDTTWIYCTALFTNGCKDFDSIMIQTVPNYIFLDTAGVCEGESYAWCDTILRTPGEYMKHYWSNPHYCDSTRYMHFVVSHNTTSTDYVQDCKPYTWINGHTYKADNTDTRNTDTVHIVNQWGCDSTVYLDFTFIPMKAIIEHTPEVATLDQLTIELRDASYGHDSHLWLLPDGSTSISPTTYVNFPLSGIDTMTVRLAVHNNYGCDDTARSDIPLHKVSEFIPNVFSPGRPENNLWRPMVKGNISDVRVWIYNRQGEQVYYFQGDESYWDGRDMNGNPLPQGSYVYIMRFRSSLEPTMTQETTGTITLVR